MAVTTAEAWAGVSVPAGKRLVVKTLTFANNHSAAHQQLVMAAGAVLASLLVPAATSVMLENLTVVLYAGETIAGYSYAPSGAITAHGFLFDDGGQRPAWGPPALPGAELDVVVRPDPGEMRAA